MNRLSFSILATIVAILLLCTGVSFGKNIRDVNTLIGVKGGFIGSATFYVGDFEYGSDMSYSLGGFLDYKLGPKIFGGLSLDIHGISGVYENSVTLIDLSATIKAMVYSEGSNLTFRPEFGLGYGALGDLDPYGTSSHLLLKGGCEVVFATQGNLSYLGELMLAGSLDGGNDDVAITFGPTVLVRGGIIF